MYCVTPSAPREWPINATRVRSSRPVSLVPIVWPGSPATLGPAPLLQRRIRSRVAPITWVRAAIPPSDASPSKEAITLAPGETTAYPREASNEARYPYPA